MSALTVASVCRLTLKTRWQTPTWLYFSLPFSIQAPKVMWDFLQSMPWLAKYTIWNQLSLKVEGKCSLSFLLPFSCDNPLLFQNPSENRRGKIPVSNNSLFWLGFRCILQASGVFECIHLLFQSQTSWLIYTRQLMYRPLQHSLPRWVSRYIDIIIGQSSGENFTTLTFPI